MSEAPQTVTEGKVVTFHYTLTNDAGEIIDRSAGEPLSYLHGAGNIVPGLEREMTGKQAGDSFRVTVSPEEGYGPKQGPGPQAVPRSAFPGDGEIAPGMQFAAQAENGGFIPLWVTKVEEQTVWVDANHPLAGETLHFSIEVVELRDASDEEKSHGHPHGPDGHHHHD